MIESGSKCRGSQRKRSLLNEISGEEALVVLRALAQQDRRLAETIEQLIDDIISEVKAEDIAQEVFCSLEQIEVQELWDRSGSTRYGYMDPDEMAWTMFEEALESFVEQLRKYLRLSMFPQAKRCCLGVILGIYQYARESKAEFRDWTGDAPEQFALTIFDEWEQGQQSPEDIAEVRGRLQASCLQWFC